MEETFSTGIEDAKELGVDELLTRLGSGMQGIPDAEASGRLEKYGYNELIEKKTSPLRRFVGYFWGPIPWMIEIAAMLSAVIQRWDDFIIIFLLLVLNGVVGFWQIHGNQDFLILL